MIETPFSLLWPTEDRPKSTTVSTTTARDLGLDSLVAALSRHPDQRRVIRDVLLTLATDPAVIGYRQAILADLLAHPTLIERLDALLPLMDRLEQVDLRRGQRPPALFVVAERLGVLEALIECITGLDAALAASDDLQSAGLRRLRRQVVALANDPTFNQLKLELPELARQVRGVRSITIGVNLDDRLQPIAATLLSANAEPFADAGLLERLFGPGDDAPRGIARLHKMPQTPREASFEIKPLMVPLFRDLADVLEKVSRPVATALKAYSHLHGRFFTVLAPELGFYLSAAALVKRLDALGFPTCFPKLADRDARLCRVADNYNVNLVLHLSRTLDPAELRQTVVSNAIRFDDAGRILILTGPNQGGKTTYIQTVGLTHLMAQAGLPVPGTEAIISPVDRLETHFPVEELLERGTGRFGDEAQRLGELFGAATRHSLLLLNESLSSTSAGESLYIAQDLMRILRRLGARVLFATHLHDLAQSADTLNASTPGDSRILSLVASRVRTAETDRDGAAALRRSYVIAPGPPQGHSYARELAATYGISYEQLMAQLTRRGAIDAASERAPGDSGGD